MARIAIAALLLAALTAASPPPLLFRAAQAGQRTLDGADGAGNPFASALIDLLTLPQLNLDQLPSLLAERTAMLSEGFQEADLPPGKLLPAVKLRGAAGDGVARVALVLVHSNYARAGIASLPGAAHDATRVAAALAAAGYRTTTLLDPTPGQAAAALTAFRAASSGADVALLYTTGHGAEVGGVSYLLPGDFPAKQGNAALGGRAIRVTDLGKGMAARRANLLLFAGCRDDPFAAP